MTNPDRQETLKHLFQPVKENFGMEIVLEEWGSQSAVRLATSNFILTYSYDYGGYFYLGISGRHGFGSPRDNFDVGGIKNLLEGKPILSPADNRSADGLAEATIYNQFIHTNFDALSAAFSPQNYAKTKTAYYEKLDAEVHG